MIEANYNSDDEFVCFKSSTGDIKNSYIKARIAEQSDRHRLLDMFHEGIIPLLIGLRMKMEMTKYPDSITAEIKQLKDMVDSAIENAHILSNEIAPHHVLFRVGLRDALYEMFREYAELFRLRYYISLKNADLSQIDESLKLVLYYLVKSLITGVAKICDADIVGINIRTNNNAIEILIQDNGSFSDDFETIISTGYSQEQAFLLEAAQIVNSLGGKFWIDKAIGMRTVCALIPLNTKSSSRFKVQ